MSERIVSFVYNDFKNDIRVYKQNESLKNAGFDVLVVATRAEGEGKRSVFRGLNVYHVGVDFEGFLPTSLLKWWLVCIWTFRKEKVLHCNDLYALPIGAMIKLLFNRKAKIVYDCHEHETEAHVYAGKPFTKFVAKVIEKAFIGTSDVVLTVSDSIAKEYAKLYGIDPPELILNCPSYQECEPQDLFREAFDIPKESKILLYQGEYRPGRGLETMVEAFKRRGNDMSVVAVFLGYGPYGDVIKKKAGNAPNIYFHPKVGQDVYMDYVASADIGIHLMENTCLNHDFALPNKLFEYAMAGIPVIVSNMREMGGFVRANKIGYVLDKNDADHLGGVLEQVAKDDLAQFGPALKQVSQSFNWEAQEKKFVAIYRGLVPAQAGL